MADRGLDVLEKYDFEVKRTYKGRGVIMVDTDKGPRVLKNYIGSGRHLEWCAPVLEKLKESGVEFNIKIPKGKDWNEDLLTAKEKAVLRNTEVSECRELRYS